MKHPYDAFCGCNACEIEGHARDNVSDGELSERRENDFDASDLDSYSERQGDAIARFRAEY